MADAVLLSRSQPYLSALRVETGSLPPTTAGVVTIARSFVDVVRFANAPPTTSIQTPEAGEPSPRAHRTAVRHRYLRERLTSV
jgi:hypothetical protein